MSRVIIVVSVVVTIGSASFASRSVLAQPTAANLLPDEQAAKGETERSKTIVISSVTPKPSTTPNTAVSRYGLTRDDEARIRKAFPDAESIIAERDVRRTISFGSETRTVTVVGTGSNRADHPDVVLRSGQFFSEKDSKHFNNVAVITEAVAADLFGDESAIGENLRIGADYFLILGVIENSRGLTWGSATVFIPRSTMQVRFGDLEVRTEQGSIIAEEFELSRIEVTFRSADEVAAARRQVDRILKPFHTDGDYSISIIQPNEKP